MKKSSLDFLVTGIIHPSSFPLGAAFFLVAKMNNTLRHFIDYCGNMSNATSQFQILKLQHFSKLDLHKVYHPVHISQVDDFLNDVIFFIKDILNISHKLEGISQQVRLVLQRLLENRLYVSHL